MNKNKKEDLIILMSALEDSGKDFLRNLMFIRQYVEQEGITEEMLDSDEELMAHAKAMNYVIDKIFEVI